MEIERDRTDGGGIVDFGDQLKGEIIRAVHRKRKIEITAIRVRLRLEWQLRRILDRAKVD